MEWSLQPGHWQGWKRSVKVDLFSELNDLAFSDASVEHRFSAKTRPRFKIVLKIAIEGPYRLI